MLSEAARRSSSPGAATARAQVSNQAARADLGSPRRGAAPGRSTREPPPREIHLGRPPLGRSTREPQSERSPRGDPPGEPSTHGAHPRSPPPAEPHPGRSRPCAAIWERGGLARLGARATLADLAAPVLHTLAAAHRIFSAELPATQLNPRGLGGWAPLRILGWPRDPSQASKTQSLGTFIRTLWNTESGELS